LVTGNLEVTGTITGAGGSFLPLIGGTMTGNTIHNDNVKSIYGTSSDGLEVYHDGSDSYISDTGTGHLFVKTNGDGIYFRSETNEEIAHFNRNAGVKLFYDNSSKFETTSTGISVTGNGAFSGNVTIPNAGELLLGSSAGLKAFHDGSLGFIRNSIGDFYVDQLAVTQSIIFRVSDANPNDTTALTISRNADASFGRNVTIAGDLTVNGTTTTVNSQTLAVVDPLIQLAKDNTANSLDIGLYGDYNDGTDRFLGLFSDASDSNKFKLFKGTTVEPTTTVDIGATGYEAADLEVAGLEGATGVFTGALSSVGLSGTTATFSASINASGNSNTFGNTTTAALSATSGTFSSSITAAGNSNSFGVTTFTGNVEIRSGNKLILQRPNNGVATEISTDSTGAMILNSINDEGFFFNNNGTNAFKLDPINATFAGNITVDKSTGVAVADIISGDNYSVLTLKGGQTGDAANGFGIYSGYPSAGDFTIRENGVGNYLTIAKTTGNTTFAGSVGIAAAPLQSKLDILNNGDYDSHTGHGLAINSNASNAYTSMYMGADDSVDAAYIQSAGRNTSFTSKKLLLNPNGGNVGINATDPVKTLDVRGSLAISNSTGSYWYIDRNDATGNFDLNENVNGTLFSVTTNGLGSFVNTSIGDKLLLAGDDAASARGLMFNCSTTTNQGDTWDIDAQSSTGIIKFSTGSTPRMTIDSSGNVGIGLTPNASYSKLQVKAPSSSYGFDLVGRDAGINSESQLTFWNSNQTTQLAAIFNTTDNLGFVTGTTERMRIESSGRIKVSGLNYDPTSAGGNDTGGLFLVGDVLGDQEYTAGIGFALATGTAGISGYQNGSDADRIGLSFFTHGSGTGSAASAEMMRIKSGGEVGIGTLAPSSKLFVNDTADGDKIRWGKDDTLVGSVGTYNGVPYIGYQGGTGGGIMFNGKSIEPTGIGTARTDNENDIGGASYRWRNAYLSGGVFLGGTGTANKLNDYEEGTWTPVLGGTWTTNPTNISAHYTKIGRQVTITMQFLGGVKSSTVSGYFSGIPFNIVRNGTGSVTNSAVSDLGNCLFANGDRVWLTATNLGSGTVYVSGTYFAS
jgi:hypothetical protein